MPNTFSSDDITFQVNLNRELSAPIQKGEVFGTAEVVYNGQVISTIELVSDRDLTRSLFKKLGFLKYVFFVIALLFLAMLAMRAYNMNKRKKRKMRLNAQRIKYEERMRSARPSIQSRDTESRNTEREIRRRNSLDRTTRNLERSAKITTERAKMRTDRMTRRELTRHHSDANNTEKKEP